MMTFSKMIEKWEEARKKGSKTIKLLPKDFDSYVYLLGGSELERTRVLEKGVTTLFRGMKVIKKGKSLAAVIKFYSPEYISTFSSREEAKEEILISLKSLLKDWCKEATVNHEHLKWIEFDSEEDLKRKISDYERKHLYPKKN